MFFPLDGYYKIDLGLLLFKRTSISGAFLLPSLFMFVDYHQVKQRELDGICIIGMRLAFDNLNNVGNEKEFKQLLNTNAIPINGFLVRF